MPEQMMTNLLLPGTPDFLHAARMVIDGGIGLSNRQGELALGTITALYLALCNLHTVNAEGTCPTCPTAAAWKSEGLKLVREALEEAP